MNANIHQRDTERSDISGSPAASKGRMFATHAPPGARIRTCARAEGLAAIKDADTELVIWERELLPPLKTWLERLDTSRLPDMRVLVRPDEAQNALGPEMDACGMSPGPMRDMLVEDIEDLAHAFARIANSDLVDISLKRVVDNACWKFHRDCVEARLLTTYCGPATEWVHPQHGVQALREQKRYRGPLERLRIHDVAVFKGSCAGPGTGIVHRSPPIEGTGRTRLFLCLNSPSPASPEPWQGGSQTWSQDRE